MTTEDVLKSLKGFIENNVASKILLKKNPTQDGRDDDGYAYSREHPHVFTLFVPTPEREPDISAPHTAPSLTIILDGLERKGGVCSASVSVRALIYDPGNHAGDSLGQTKPAFSADMAGYKSLLSVLDRIANEVCKNKIIDGKIRVKTENSVKINALTRTADGLVVDFYPMFYGFVDFEIEFVYNSARPDDGIL